MQYLFEYSDTLNRPYEAFVFDASRTNFPVRSHWHYYTEIIYMRTGRAMVECDGTTYVLEEGDMIIFYPEAVHAIYSAKGLPIIFEGLKFDANALHAPSSYTPRINRILQKARSDKNLPVIFREEKIRNLNIERYFKTCREELREKKYGYNIILHNTISELLLNIIRLWDEKGFDLQILAIEPEQYAKESIRSIAAYIDEHSGEPLRVEELAEKCAMSYSFFAKSFHELYGKSCKEYIEEIRIVKAEDMLLFTSQNLSWIAQETGFSDSSHLIKTFTRYKGITPKQYRMQHQKKTQQE